MSHLPGRVGCHSDSAARGARTAIQIADRWHLWHNLGEAAERAVAWQRCCLRAAINAATGQQPSGQALRSSYRAAQGHIAERTRQRYGARHRLLAESNTVRPSRPNWARPAAPSAGSPGAADPNSC
jgi:hypothetical protein